MTRAGVAVVFAFLIVIIGCGNNSSGPAFTGSPTPSPTATPSPSPTPTPSDPDRRAAFLVSQMTLDEKIQMVHGALTLENAVGPRGAVGWTPGIPRLGIPDLLYADMSTVGPATAMPSSLASAASWDLEEAYKYGEVLGKEMRAFGMNVHLGGNVNLTAREPRDGRTFETKGEDPLLAGRITAAHLRAVQAQHLIAGPKHFAMNDQETARFSANALVDERSARESDLLAFEIALKDSGAQMVMCAYNLVNGTKSCGNSHLLNEVLKHDWQFPGFVISDWYATPDGVPAAAAGLDQEQPGQYQFGGIWSSESLKTAVQNGDLSLSRLNDMAQRVLRAMCATGVMDNPTSVQPIDADADAAVAQEIAEQGAVLLKNSGTQLPLNSSTVGSIAVIGGHADVGVLSGAGSSQISPVGGPALDLPQACPPYTPSPGGTACTNSRQIYDPSSPVEAIRAKGVSVDFNPGTDPAAAATFAASHNVAIVFVNQWASEGMDAVDLSFADDQDALVTAIAETNPRTIVVMENGGPQLMPWLSEVNAVLEAWYPGQRGGQAIANLLFGAVNPSGKLPISFPASVADLPRPAIPIPNPPDSNPLPVFDIDYGIEGFNVGYKWFDKKEKPALFPFGFGLSYTTFAIADAQLSVASEATNGFEVSFDLHNTGSRAGAEVAQVYLALPDSAGELPKRLVGWKKVPLGPGTSQQVTISVDANDSSHPLSVWSTISNGWTTPNGDYTVYVGNSSASSDLTIAGTFHVGP